MIDVLYDAPAIQDALDHMAMTMQSPEVYIIGIQRGGAIVADALQQRLQGAGCNIQRGNLDIGFYRDDLDTIGSHPEIHPSDIPFDVSGKHIWLVDDVLYTGRTIRAALGEIFDYGRPDCVRLAVLVDRGERELPIAADLTGLHHEVPAGTSVKLVAGTTWHIEKRRVNP